MAEALYHNLDDRTLADALGAVSAELRCLERRKEALRRAILDRGVDLIRGMIFEVPVVERTRNSLDESAIRADMGDEWVEQYVRHTLYHELRPRPASRSEIHSGYPQR
jgi:hypothetical protein